MVFHILKTYFQVAHCLILRKQLEIEVPEIKISGLNLKSLGNGFSGSVCFLNLFIYFSASQPSCY